MREAMIILPQHDNARHSLQHVRHYAEKALAAAFGGFTVTNGKGGWINSRGELLSEPVWQFTVACEPTPQDDAKLTSIARYMGTEGKQDAVYVRYASGDVQILETDKTVKKAA